MTLSWLLRLPEFLSHSESIISSKLVSVIRLSSFTLLPNYLCASSSLFAFLEAVLISCTFSSIFSRESFQSFCIRAENLDCWFSCFLLVTSDVCFDIGINLKLFYFEFKECSPCVFFLKSSLDLSLSGSSSLVRKIGINADYLRYKWTDECLYLFISLLFSVNFYGEKLGVFFCYCEIMLAVSWFYFDYLLLTNCSWEALVWPKFREDGNFCFKFRFGVSGDLGEPGCFCCTNSSIYVGVWH